jgi:hypothetical protein
LIRAAGSRQRAAGRESGRALSADVGAVFDLGPDPDSSRRRPAAGSRARSRIGESERVSRPGTCYRELDDSDDDEEARMGTWEASWEMEMPVESPEDLLLGLVIRDLVHGSSYDVEIAETGVELLVDYAAGDEIEPGAYRLLIGAEVEGPEDAAILQEFTEEVLDGMVAEAEQLIVQRQELAEVTADELRFTVVDEDEERWDLVVPDWVAPDGAEIPFGFRPFLERTGDPWPGNEVIDEHGRVVLVPFEGTVRMYGIPAPTEVEGGG